MFQYFETMTDEPENKLAGNKFWKLRSKHGADPKYSDPEKLRQACEEYFDWVADNPLNEEKVGFYEGSACRADTSRMRAMTIEGLSVFIGVVPATWYDWRKNRDDLSEIIGWAESILRSYNIEGAGANMINHNIVARYHGLNDVRAHQQLDAYGEPIDPIGGGNIHSQKIADAVEKEMQKITGQDKDGNTEAGA